VVEPLVLRLTLQRQAEQEVQKGAAFSVQCDFWETRARRNEGAGRPAKKLASSR